MYNQRNKIGLSEDDFIRAHLDESNSTAKKYAALVIGEFSIWRLLQYELITLLFGWVPGALGLVLRKIFYPMLFKHIGKGVVFGKNTTLRNTKNMSIGDGVIIDDNAFIDARGSKPGEFIIEQNALIGRGAVLQSKVGSLRLGARSSIGNDSVIVSQGGIDIANDVFIGGGSKISGGLFRLNDSSDAKIFDRYSKGPITIDERCILGMGCIVIDNVHIGSRSMIGSGVTVSGDIPEDSIAGSRPPLVMKKPATDGN
ncbi:MAG: DapH/DapD/GlmU-related protein [Pirellulales bacterium]